MTNATHNEVQMIVAEVLLANGWTRSNGAALATKYFETAVGPKEAHIYLTKGDEYNRKIYGQYWSEGRNAIENCSILIPVDADAAKITERAEKFIAYAQDNIARTFAANLMLWEPVPKLA